MRQSPAAGEAAVLHVSPFCNVEELALMNEVRGIGYGEDLLVCAALGIDMADCVFPTRTAVSRERASARSCLVWLLTVASPLNAPVNNSASV